MLTELRIDQFAIIEHLELDLQPGLLTFTGETGAGKSIILDAITTLLGGRVDNTMIRSGADRALVEATFQLPRKNRQDIQQILINEELLADENPELLTLSRELRRKGRSTARINGRSVNVSLLSELGSFLIDIHGQSDHLSLLNERNHLGLLDRYSGSEPILTAYQNIYDRLHALRKELNTLRKNEQETARQTDFLTFQIQEIKTAQLSPDEDIELRLERDRLANAERLAELSQQSLLILDEGSPEAPAISDLLGQVIESLSSLSRIDSSQIRFHDQVESVAEILSELSHDLQNYLEQVEYNPRRLEEAEERLELIQNLKRKYGDEINDILSFAEQAHQKLETITNAGERIKEIEAEETELLEKLVQRGQELSAIRQTAAVTLSIAVEKELSDLNMIEARFAVDQHFMDNPNGVILNDEQRVGFDRNGLDKIAFLIAANPGEGFKPLAKTASGGETSRLMLALKNVLTRADYIHTLIFDEIDQGIGGRVGAVVGEKLWQLAREHQVLCVTHLPQLAAFGEQHFRVSKQIAGGRTVTEVSLLNSAERLEEMTHMLGTFSQANRSAAQETLEMAHKRAAELAKSNI
ncbi:MAG: DNA repair protein RecN [Anaerolineaceae bacterium]|nr:DNA repair protein RecN [Anaerolineaceae bacterium]